ncbi:hypothetical protein CEXT_56511 [Caerostris extrusa]|uniref:Uncharacterized protein n=1 Tax=Caerostris extrusa TaxID=172846 RepID=A0AAV4TYQ8_CAEEX|nr:hypothetical protein CEXT_56511 [Caerostris extrusa]
MAILQNSGLDSVAPPTPVPTMPEQPNASKRKNPTSDDDDEGFQKVTSKKKNPRKGQMNSDNPEEDPPPTPPIIYYTSPASPAMTSDSNNMDLTLTNDTINDDNVKQTPALY